MPEIHVRPLSEGYEERQRDAAQTYWELGDRVTARRMDEKTFGSSTSDSDGFTAFILMCVALVVVLARWVLG